MSPWRMSGPITTGPRFLTAACGRKPRMDPAVWILAFARTASRERGLIMTSPRSVSRAPLSTVTAGTIVTSQLDVETTGMGFFDVTSEVEAFLHEAGGQEGAVTAFIRHTSASLTIQENADPSVLEDLSTALDRLAPQKAGWVHDLEGPDDMPAHIKTMLTSVSLTVPVRAGKLALGTWQGIYLAEHRKAPHRRQIVLQFCGRVA